MLHRRHNTPDPDNASSAQPAGTENHVGKQDRSCSTSDSPCGCAGSGRSGWSDPVQHDGQRYSWVRPAAHAAVDQLTEACRGRLQHRVSDVRAQHLLDQSAAAGVGSGGQHRASHVKTGITCMREKQSATGLDVCDLGSPACVTLLRAPPVCTRAEGRQGVSTALSQLLPTGTWQTASDPWRLPRCHGKPVPPVITSGLSPWPAQSHLTLSCCHEHLGLLLDGGSAQRGAL